MAGPYIEVSVVHTGTEQTGPCRDGCGGTEIASPVVAMDPTGTLPIGELVGCDGCGDRWLCGFCPEVLPFDGKDAHRHMLTRHAA